MKRVLAAACSDGTDAMVPGPTNKPLNRVRVPALHTSPCLVPVAVSRVVLLPADRRDLSSSGVSPSRSKQSFPG